MYSIILTCVTRYTALLFLLLFLTSCTNSSTEVASKNITITRPHGKVSNTLMSTNDSLRIDSTTSHAASLRYRYPDSSLALLEKILAECKTSHYNNGIERALVVKALVLVEKANYEGALASMKEAKPYIMVQKQEILWHLNLAVVYSYTENYNKQLHNYMEAIRLLDSMGNKNDLLYVPLYLNVSNVWSAIGDADKRNYYLNKAIEIAPQNISTSENNFFSKDALSGLYNTQGSDLIDKLKFDEAIPVLQKSIALCDTFPLLVKRKKNAYILLSFPHLHKEDYALAEQYVDSYKIINNNEDQYASKMEPNTMLAEIYYKKGNHQQALLYAREATAGILIPGSYHKAKEIRIRRIKADALQVTGNATEAAQEYQILLQLIDSNQNAEKIKTNRQLDFMYQAGIKDKKLADNQLLLARNSIQLKNQKIVIGMVVTGLVITLLLLYVFRNTQKLQKKAFLLQSRENELKYLKEITSIEEQQRRKIGAELHDGISGSMAAIKMNMGTMKKQYPLLNHSEIFLETQDMIKETTEEVRRTAHNLIPEILLKNGLNEALITYINRIRNNPALDLEYNYFIKQPALSEEACLTLYRIVQELLQNIIVHAQASKASIQLLENKGKVNVMVEDNGVGFNVEEAVNGIGLHNIKVRVLALEGEIDIKSILKKQTVVRLSFDKEKLI